MSTLVSLKGIPTLFFFTWNFVTALNSSIVFELARRMIEASYSKAVADGRVSEGQYIFQIVARTWFKNTQVQPVRLAFGTILRSHCPISLARIPISASPIFPSTSFFGESFATESRTMREISPEPAKAS